MAILGTLFCMREISMEGNGTASTASLTKWRLWGTVPNISVGLLASSFLINILSLALPIALVQIFDRILPYEQSSSVVILTLAVITALCFELVIRSLRSLASAFSDARHEYLTTKQAFEHLLNTPLSEYEKEGPGTHLERMTSINTLKDFYAGQGLASIFDLPFALLFVAVIAYIAGWLAVIPVIALALLGLGALFLSFRIRDCLITKRAGTDRRLNFIIEILNNIHTLKALAMEALMLRRYERLQTQSARQDEALSLQQTSMATLSQALYKITLLAMVGFGCIMTLEGHLTLGGLAATTFLAGRILYPVTRSLSVWMRIQSIQMAQNRLQRILALPQETDDTQETSLNIEGNIEFKHVTFSYRKDARPIFSQLNLTLNANETIAVTGTGLNGKTTLLRLIMGTAIPDEGQILIDGQDLATLNKRSLREQIAYLPQQPVLFKGTVLENLGLFRDKATLDKAKGLAEDLGLDRTIHRLPNGYQTIIGHSSEDILPRGIRARIAIVQALIQDPRILLFDEANSAIDIEGDERLKQLLLRYKTRCTMILVTHRPSLLNIADTIYVLRQGQLVKQTYDY